MMNTLFTQALDIRVAYAKAVIFENKIDQIIYVIEAHILGADAYRAGLPNVPELFKTVPSLNRAWDKGVHAAINGRVCSRLTEEEGFLIAEEVQLLALGPDEECRMLTDGSSDQVLLDVRLDRNESSPGVFSLDFRVQEIHISCPCDDEY